MDFSSGDEQRADRPDLVLAHPHQHLAPILGVGGALDQAEPLEPIYQAGDRATGQPGAARDLARRRRAVQQDEVEALEVARIDPDLLGDRLAVQHARRRGAAHGRHQAADQGLPALLTGSSWLPYLSSTKINSHQDNGILPTVLQGAPRRRWLGTAGGRPGRRRRCRCADQARGVRALSHTRTAVCRRRS